MKYFFVLGNNPSVSIAELSAVLDLKEAKILAPDFLLWPSSDDINVENMMKRLGGVIKIGVVRKESNNNQLINDIQEIAFDKKKGSPEGKFNFGFSDYGQGLFNKKDLGIKLKNAFKEKDISSRFVISKEKTLSSVVITQNKLIKRGIEIVLVKEGEKILMGETLAVQDFKDFSKRDYGRPARDDHSGMLPPKLAQMMINMAQIHSSDSHILDPFCGSGTVLTEALIMGYRNLFGADISLEAIDNTKKNINWIKKKYEIEHCSVHLKTKNVLNLSKFVKVDSVDYIITEPYLGPQRGQIDFEMVIKELENLYTDALKEFKQVLKKGGRVVMIWPLFYGSKSINPDYTGFKIEASFSDHLTNSGIIKKTKRGTVVWSRDNQKVFREIVILEKE